LAGEERSKRRGGGDIGDVSLYNQNGDHLSLLDGNKMKLETKEFDATLETKGGIDTPELTLKGGKVIIDGDLVVTGGMTCSGSLSVTGAITAAEVTASTVTLTGHTHTGDSGGTTAPPNPGT
jgi:phage gp45-like